MKETFLQGKRAIVTGASRGIGEEIVRVLASYGADVVVGYSSSKEKAEKVAEEIQAKNQVRAKAIVGKLEDITSLKSFMQSAIEFLGGVDILVNNAGVETVHYALDLPVEKWDRIMNVNLRAPFYCAQEAGKIMHKQHEEDPSRDSVIINISSIHDDVPRMGLIHYCSSKAGLKMMTRALGLEFAEFRTRVVCLSPGAIETDMNRDEINRLLGREHFESWVPARRIGNVHEVAETVAFLASPAASYITSTTLYIDGGYSQNIIKYDDRKL